MRKPIILSVVIALFAVATWAQLSDVGGGNEQPAGRRTLDGSLQGRAAGIRAVIHACALQ